ncbi:hypothetical protein SAMN05421752_103200 [Natronorubrum thiooxidans]|uniref:Uncharacterized protein n=1 Tax=Natronorubrum thiooxidans TaxID=308853 RepID=A0A1N7E4N5_9EURY|nr:hypothetical protein SAMN05421752_103200 [Natronorubrum thiooxidans]
MTVLSVAQPWDAVLREGATVFHDANADHNSWVEPAEIADMLAVLCSDGTAVTSGAAVPVYAET